MAAAITVPISLATHPVGSQSYGPASIAVGYTDALVTIDRTAGTASLNATPAAQMDLTVEVSYDSGSSWWLVASTGVPGGSISRTGNAPWMTATVFECGLHHPELVRLARLTVVVSGAPVSLSGTLTLS